MKKLCSFIALAVVCLTFGGMVASCGSDDDVTPSPQTSDETQTKTDTYANVKYIGYVSSIILKYADVKICCAISNDTTEIPFNVDTLKVKTRDSEFWTSVGTIDLYTDAEKRDIKVLVANTATKITPQASASIFMTFKRNNVALPLDGTKLNVLSGWSYDLVSTNGTFNYGGKTFQANHGLDMGTDKETAENRFAQVLYILTSGIPSSFYVY